MEIPGAYSKFLKVIFLFALLAPLAACFHEETKEDDLTAARPTPEERQAEMDAFLEKYGSGLGESGDLFDLTIRIDDGGKAEQKGCRPEFVAKRWRRAQYRTKGFEPSNELCGRNRPPTVLKDRVSIPIYWLNLSSRRANANGNQIGWSDALALAKMQEAERWFAGFCIDLDINPVSVSANRLRNMRAAMDAAIAGRLYKGEAVTVESVSEGTNKQLYKSELHKPHKYLLVLFTDAFRSVRYGGPTSRVNQVAGNFESIPVILVPDPPDSASTNIITHELIHGLGKVLAGKNSIPHLQSLPVLDNPSAEEVSMSQQATWDEGGCGTDMGNAGRADPTSALTKPNSDLMDWASFWQFDHNRNTRVR